MMFILNDLIAAFKYMSSCAEIQWISVYSWFQIILPHVIDSKNKCPLKYDT